jgi:predicted permease
VKFLHRLTSIITLWFRRDRVERELSDELETFVAMSADDKMRDGYSREDARRLAVLELGGVEQARERVRTYRHGGGIDDVGRDLRYAFRMFRRTPGFTTVVIITMALGIGANTAVFSVIEALMLRPLPVPNATELVQLSFGPMGSPAADRESLSYTLIKSLDAQREIFNGVAGFSGFGFDAGRPGAIESVSGALVTGAYYETLGLVPVAGRLLTRADDEPGAPSVAVISHGYWQRQFAGRANVIGESLLINRHPVSIVGVSPPRFVGANVGSTADITMPVAAVAALRPSLAPILLAPGTTWLRVLARPTQGVTLAEAASRLNTVWPGLSESVMHPSWDAERRRTFAESRFSLSPGSTGWTDLRATYRQPLIVLMIVTGLVLLVACANIAGLMVVRSTGRQREMAIRLAIGAARSRIVRQILLEGVVLRRQSGF